MKNSKKDLIIAGTILGKIIIIIALIELLIMAILHNYLHHLGVVEEALIDSLLLSLLSAPLIYFWIIDPYVTNHNQAKETLGHMAYHDHLTQLPNRRFLSECLKKNLAICHRHKLHGALLLLDLDNFKAINDNYGHQAGDMVLKEIARRLSIAVRTEDTASRLGGDEFVVVMHPLEGSEEQIRSNANTVAKKFHDILSAPIKFNDQELQIHTSIGIRLLNAETLGIDEVLKEADNAMYYAKQHQPAESSHVFFEDSITKAALKS